MNVELVLQTATPTVITEEDAKKQTQCESRHFMFIDSRYEWMRCQLGVNEVRRVNAPPQRTLSGHVNFDGHQGHHTFFRLFGYGRDWKTAVKVAKANGIDDYDFSRNNKQKAL